MPLGFTTQVTVPPSVDGAPCPSSLSEHTEPRTRACGAVAVGGALVASSGVGAWAAAGSGVVVGGAAVVGGGCVVLVVEVLVVEVLVEGALVDEVVVAREVTEVDGLVDDAMVVVPPFPSTRAVVAELASPTEISANTPMATTQSEANTSTRAAMRRAPYRWRAVIGRGSSCS